MNALLAKKAHTDQQWRIHELACDFEVYDVWALPTPGGPNDFPILLQGFRDADLAKNPSAVFRALFAIRWRLGKWFGWDGPQASVGSRVASLRERLPEDLVGNEIPKLGALPFTPLYATDTEWAAEMANLTCHGVMHIGWVPDSDFPGRYRGQMAVLVKPNGWVGRVYMAAIAPFRFFLVYPPLMRAIAVGWLEKTAPTVQAKYAWSPRLETESIPTQSDSSNYADSLTMTTSSTTSARWWVSTMFEELIQPFGREILFRGVLALHPVRGSSSLMNWQVIEEFDDLIRLQRSGPLMSCVLTLETGSELVRLGLSVEPRSRLGAAIWRKVSPVHRRMGGILLRRAWQRSEQVRTTSHRSPR